MKVSLCLLVWNEIEGCRRDISRLPREEFDEVYAVDGGSRDGTREFLRDQGIPVHDQLRRGYNGALLTAAHYCKTDAIVLFHPKGSVAPESCRFFRPLFEAGHELIVASRMIEHGENEEDVGLLRPRKWFVLLLSHLCSFFWKREGERIVDVLHGIRGIRKDLLETISLRSTGVTADLEMVIGSYRLRSRRIEFPVIERPTPYRKTHFPTMRTGARILRYVLGELLRGE